MTLVLVDRDGNLLGQLPAFDVETPWWQDLEPILARHPDVVILRLLAARPEPGRVMGGPVTYLAQSRLAQSRLAQSGGSRPTGSGARPAAFTGLSAALDDHPLRMAWARPGGPDADLEWARSHVRMTGPPAQVRSWNLSSLWRLPTAEGTVWLKHVPPFFAHEAAVISALGPSPSLPRLVAADGARMLMADMPGRDGYDASPAEHIAIVRTLVWLQVSASARGVPGGPDPVMPDWTAAAFGRAAGDLVSRRRDASSRPALDGILDDWDARFAALSECGLPDVVFHGDAHPGNARIGTDPPVVFDWGDSGVGHPLLDLAVLSGYDTPGRADVRRAWLEEWARAVPGSDPARAWQLLRPLAILRAAVVFQRFLDNIEPSERVYHRDDVDLWLDRAAAAAAG